MEKATYIQLDRIEAKIDYIINELTEEEPEEEITEETINKLSEGEKNTLEKTRPLVEELPKFEDEYQQ